MITANAAAIEAKYAGKSAAQDNLPPPLTGQENLKGTPVPEGTVIQQLVGRAMAVVPPADPNAPKPPQISVVPPQHSGRTTIGTFVDIPKPPSGPAVIESTSNPLTEPKVEEEPPPPEKPPLDLAKEFVDFINAMGGSNSPEAKKFFDRSEQAIRSWLQRPAAIPLYALKAFLEREPGVAARLAQQLEPHFAASGREGYTQSLPTRGKLSVTVCSAVLDRPTLPFMWSLLYLAKKYEIGFDIQADTMIARSRNMLADRFLKSGAQWSLWLDSDVAAPIANSDWFRWISQTNTLAEDQTRLDVLEHLLGQNKPIIGGVYASRKYHGALVIQPEINPRSQEDKILCNDLRKGISRGLIEVDWIGFGCCMIHRQVFLELQRAFPKLAPQSEFAPWRFFQPEGDEGEDEAFCRRAKACSIPIWLDTKLVCGHIGSMCFLPEHSAPVPAL
jgi:hypothetical protein